MNETSPPVAATFGHASTSSNDYEKRSVNKSGRTFSARTSHRLPSARLTITVE